MNDHLKNVLENVLKMPHEQRAFIASRLIDSLDETMDTEVELAWQQEIQKRIADAGRGKASFMSWEDAKERLRG